jgi:hypothetical protein
MYTGVKDVDNIIDNYIGDDISKIEWKQKKRRRQKATMWNLERLVLETVEYRNQIPMCHREYETVDDKKKCVDEALKELVNFIEGVDEGVYYMDWMEMSIQYDRRDQVQKCKRLLGQFMNFINQIPPHIIRRCPCGDYECSFLLKEGKTECEFLAEYRKSDWGSHC